MPTSEGDLTVHPDAMQVGCLCGHRKTGAYLYGVSLHRDGFDLHLMLKFVCIFRYSKDVTIVSFPVCIESHKYKRNKMLFNLGFAFDSNSYTGDYEPVCRKIAKYLRESELRDEFLSNPETKVRLPEFMIRLREELLTTGQCSFQINEWCLIYVHLPVTLPEPPDVWDFYVPVMVRQAERQQIRDEWDGTLKRVYPHIDGKNHVADIAHKAAVDTVLVRKCIQHLVYYQICVLVDIFQYGNTYMVTPAINTLYNDGPLQAQCCVYVHDKDAAPPHISTIFSLYTRLSADKDVSTFCEENEQALVGVDVLRFIQFGMVFGILRCVRRWPVVVNDCTAENRTNSPTKKTVFSVPDQIKRMFTGGVPFDEVCYKLCVSASSLAEAVTLDPTTTIIKK
ncbi:hypothetical protein SARC_02142 [Sphaeroforma arctica JP610]|uniref:Nitrogen permease regulator 2 n=1 Tax=Sphaeroforma arctica JP610 TaxID=667725 RepID=A0A0L0GBR9_9EUKA|nr:hypothetical protein SARC_02142 [Sphaeroforma arctica JP610]KNC85693.1 hypothetical protein SARC_02142 [Sphaeroforma arctica JP610]|eukprot:XP_014159595.1 hypothetical protein SARC_02142 [Sphaeroforma arctica JP610]